ncbi:putative glutamine amidotransferase [Mycetocola sp. CAN_C7]|uniref:class II glutamine amidotransferase n=1 Tax=Mycetocola sp. CAN_C7 TaxID=2787724 RepID=UPI0018CA18D4
MCRLLGYVSRHPTAVLDVLGPDDFASFTSLTAVHGDGWGAAWHDADGRIRSINSTGTAILDDDYAAMAATRLGTSGLLHLRWATAGLPICPENTHPFVDGDYAFAHNGNISPIPHLDSLLTPESLARLTGDTDSERYFRLLLQCIAEAGDDTEGVTRGLAILQREFPDFSLNALLLSPEALFAVHINSRAESPPRALRALFEHEDSMPARHATEYYAMDYRVTEDAVHVISSGLDAAGWTPMPSDTAIRIDLGSRDITHLVPRIDHRAAAG